MSLAGRWTNEIRGREEGDQSRRRSRRNSDGTRQDAMELFKWNSRNEAAVGSKLGEWVVCTRRYFFCVLRLFLLSHFVSPPSSVVLFYYILYIFIIYYSRNVDFWFGEGSKFFFLSSSPSNDRLLFFEIFQTSYTLSYREFKILDPRSITDREYLDWFSTTRWKSTFHFGEIVPLSRREEKPRIVSRANITDRSMLRVFSNFSE